MAKFNATPLVVAGLVGAGAVVGWWWLRRNPAQAGEQPTVEILAPPAGTSSPSGTRIDFSARAMVGTRDISALVDWSIIQPTIAAGFWSTGATTFITPHFLTTQPLEMEAKITDPVTGLAASARRSVLIVVAASQGLPALGPARGPAVARVVPSFRRSDTGWQVRGRHVLEEPYIFSRR